MWVQSLGWEVPLEEEMVTHFRILAWEIPWTLGACGLQSMRLQRVRHGLVTEQQHKDNTSQMTVNLLTKGHLAISGDFYLSLSNVGSEAVAIFIK